MREADGRVQCLSGCSEVDVNFEAKNGFISRPSIARVPGRIWHLGLKIPGKIISPTFQLHNTGVCSRGEMQFRPWEPAASSSRPFAHAPRRPRARDRPAQTAASSSRPFAHAPRRPPGARSGLLRGFCARAAPPTSSSRSPSEPAASSSRPFAHTRRSPLGPAQRLLRSARGTRNSPPEPARACSEAFAHRPPECTLGISALSRGFGDIARIDVHE